MVWIACGFLGLLASGFPSKCNITCNAGFDFDSVKPLFACLDSEKTQHNEWFGALFWLKPADQ
jgi:hypothetical protein